MKPSQNVGDWCFVQPPLVFVQFEVGASVDLESIR